MSDVPSTRVSASSTLVGVIGDPVRHSLSPLLHEAAYRALGLDWAYLVLEVPAGRFRAAAAGAEALGFRGLSVTMPHKEEAASIATRRSPVVRRLGAANTLSFGEHGVSADSTDGQGLLDDLRRWAGFDVAGRRCGVIGAGGAARAAILALAEAGAAEVVVVNRTPARAFKAAALARGAGRVGRRGDLDSCDLVVQATPATMPGFDRSQLTVDPSRFGSGQLVVDLAYADGSAWFLDAAARSGAKVRNGLGTLVHQAAYQVQLWSGQEPPVTAMWDAVEGAPGATGRGSEA